jgi:hypothetical protein
MEKNRILYLGYWGINDVLTASSVLPSLRYLASMEQIETILFCSIERSRHSKSKASLPEKVQHVPLQSPGSGTLLSKVYDFTIFPQIVRKVVQKHRINTIICRSSLAGGIVLRVAERLGIPVIVESFEPHADYMVDSGIWGRNDVRTFLSRRMENRLKRKATFLLPVSQNYKSQLLKEGVDPERIRVLPCVIDEVAFDFSAEARSKQRSEWGWDDPIIGIYVGKFGGIYHDKEAFAQFSEAFQFFGKRFALIILSQQPGVNELMKTCIGPGVDLDRIRILSVPHEMVPSLLSAADFAFSSIKPGPSRRFCSAIKHGEYWANGLPVIMEEGIGDDSEIIKVSGSGVVLPASGTDRYKQAFRKISKMLEQGRMALYPGIRSLATRYRSEAMIKTIYDEVFVLHA